MPSAGTERVMGPGDFFHIPPGRDGWVARDQPYVSLHVMGSEDYAVTEPGEASA